MRYFIRFTIVLLIFYFSNTNLFGQNGYKSYSWGMTLDTVKNEVKVQWLSNDYGKENPEGFAWEKYYSAVRRAIEAISITIDREASLMWHNLGISIDEFRTVLDGYSYGVFSFYNDKLISVSITHIGDILLPELIKVYGQGINVENKIGKTQAIVWENNDRFIVWYETGTLSGSEVAYIDGNWIKTILEKELIPIRARREYNYKSHID